jgi:polar amino acid transport system substrate-binding protein
VFAVRYWVFLLCWAWIGCTSALASDVVNLAIGEWPPYTSEADAHSKLLEKVVVAAFKLEGLDVKFSYFPWKRSYLKTRDGSFDGTFPWSRTPERENHFLFNKLALVTDQSVYFHLKSTPFDWATMDDLKQYKVGVTSGYKNEAVYKTQQIVADAAPSEELNFKKLIAGRIDVYETSKIVGYSTIKKTLSPDQAARFTHHPKVAEENDYYILFSRAIPNGQTLADRFDSGLRKLKASGAYAKILMP